MMLVQMACEGMKMVKRNPTSVEVFHMKDEKTLSRTR
jgi:hypothetical protein